MPSSPIADGDWFRSVNLSLRFPIDASPGSSSPERAALAVLTPRAPDGRMLLDLGMVAYVPPRMRDQLLKLVVATVDGRGEQAAETFMHMGARLENFDEARFTRETGRLVARFSSSNSRIESEAGFLLSMVKLAGDCGLKPPAELTLLGKTMLHLEAVIVALDKRVSLRNSLRTHLPQIFRERLRGGLDSSRLATDLLELQDLVREAPQRLSILLRTLADNRFRVHVAGLGIL